MVSHTSSAVTKGSFVTSGFPPPPLPGPPHHLASGRDAGISSREGAERQKRLRDGRRERRARCRRLIGGPEYHVPAAAVMAVRVAEKDPRWVEDGIRPGWNNGKIAAAWRTAVAIATDRPRSRIADIKRKDSVARAISSEVRNRPGEPRIRGRVLDRKAELAGQLAVANGDNPVL